MLVMSRWWDRHGRLLHVSERACWQQVFGPVGASVWLYGQAKGIAQSCQQQTSDDFVFVYQICVVFVVVHEGQPDEGP